MNGLTRIPGLLVAALSLLPAQALAGGFILNEHGFYIIDFIIFILIVKAVASKPIKAFFVNRSATIAKELDEAKALHAAAAERLEEYDAKLEALDAEREEIRQGFISVAEKEKAKILADATLHAERLVADVETRLTQEARQLAASLEKEAVDMAVQMAQKLAVSRLDGEGHTALVDDALKSMENMDQGDLVVQRN